MHYLIIDFEMGEVDAKDREKLSGMAKEIIETGAVLLKDDFSFDSEFASYSKPKVGYLSSYVRKMTGIRKEDLSNAPSIEQVLRDMGEWLSGKEVRALSWSDSDCRQLKREMEVKGIHVPEIDALFPTWSDFQVAFGRLLGLKERCALSDALRICHIKPVGREHDGLYDARNTASLFSKLQRSGSVAVSLTPIGKGAAPQNKKADDSCWTIERAFFAIRHGKEAAMGDGFRKYRFEKRMRKI